MPKPPRDMSTGLLRCPKCRETKPHDGFFKNKAASSGLTSWCKLCHNGSSLRWKTKNKMHFAKTIKKWRDARPEYIRDANLKARLGVPHGTYAQLHTKQRGCCAICGRPDTGRNRRESFHVDHCHASGKIRGLLCHHCNVGLGNFFDSVELLSKAADYINRTLN